MCQTSSATRKQNTKVPNVKVSTQNKKKKFNIKIKMWKPCWSAWFYFNLPTFCVCHPTSETNFVKGSQVCFYKYLGSWQVKGHGEAACIYWRSLSTLVDKWQLHEVATCMSAKHRSLTRLKYCYVVWITILRWNVKGLFWTPNKLTLWGVK